LSGIIFNLKIITPFITIRQYNDEIDEAMRSIDNGESYTHEEVVEASKNWLNGK